MYTSLLISFLEEEEEEEENKNEEDFANDSHPPTYDEAVNNSDEGNQEPLSEKTPSVNGVGESLSPSPVVIIDEEELSRYVIYTYVRTSRNFVD